MKIKQLSRDSMLANINGLSLNDRAYCGPYGVVQCVKTAAQAGSRRFTVTGSKKIRNGGNWTMASLRRAIESK